MSDLSNPPPLEPRCELAVDIVGHGSQHQAVRRRPYSVILLDEIEKAHHDVFNVLLQVMDDGRLTDGKGRTIDLRNTILIMTSNVGSSYILELTNRQEVEKRCVEALHSEFSDAAKDHLVELGYQPEFGARPLKRVLRENVLEPLSEELIAGHIRSGDVVKVDLNRESATLILRREESVAVATTS